MCRLFAITSREPLSPMTAIHALNVMKEGHDGSGVGLFLTDLGGSFERFKGAPILSGIFSNEGIRTLDRCMMEMDFMVKYKLSIRPATKPPVGTPKRDGFISKYYDPRVNRFEDTLSCASSCAPCGACRNCVLCETICPQAAISRRRLEGEAYEYVVDAGKCIGCGFCVGTCPCGIWQLVENEPLE